MNSHSKLLTVMIPALVVGWTVCRAKADDSYYTGEQVYSLQPKPESHKEMDQSAHDYQCMATLDSYPDMIMGHADNGRGVASYGLFEKEHDRFREVMDSLTWWYDLSRYDDGAMGLMPVEVIDGQVSAIMPWTKDTDWWLRHVSFTALHLNCYIEGLRKEDLY